MDSSTLLLHRQLLRLAKGAVKFYEQWIGAQTDDALLQSLKAKRGRLTVESCVEKNGHTD